MATTKELARLEGRIDHLVEKIERLTIRLDSHLDNHHGRVSQIKTSSVTAIIAALVAVAYELIRRFS